MPHHALQRYVYLLAALVLTIMVLYFGRDLILLFVASGLLAFLLLPLARHVEAWGAPRWAGALMATTVLLLLVLGIFFLAGWQLTRFVEDLPALQQAFASKGQALQVWIEEQAHISQREQLRWFNERLAELAGTGGSLLMKVFSGTGAVLAAVVPIPIIVFLLLVLKDKFRIFFEQLGSTREVLVLDILRNISSLSRKYLRGVLLVILILGTLSSIGFLLLDLKHALLLGFTIGFLNVIPYVGVLIGSLLPILIALVTKDSMMHAVGALGVCLITQFLENNLITPRIVGSSVSVNPLASVAALIGFGLLWGVVGMVLAIPITGMLKIVCDSVPSLKPYGFILGEEITYPEEQRIRMPLMSPKKGKGTT
jgi:predicted PurR-regulated permease PerM